MPTEKKVETVDELRQRIASSSIVIGLNFQGLKVGEMHQLRRRLREAGIELRVIKNTLWRIAAERAGRPTFSEIVEGPTAIAFGYGDVAASAKALTDYIRTARLQVTLRGACIDGEVLPASSVEELANLPPRLVLLAQVVGGLDVPLAGLLGLLEAPVTAFVQLMVAVPQQLLGLLEARAQQLEATS